jgi:outer membrane autotransporter protein
VCTPPQPTPDPVTGNATCTGTFNSNINYNTINTPINLTLQPGVIVTSPGGDAVSAQNTTLPTVFGADVTIVANNANITNLSNSAGNNNTGLRIQSAGAATITASGKIDVTGTASDDAILAIIEGSNPLIPKDVTVKYGIPDPSDPLGQRLLPGGGLTSSGSQSTGIQADNRGLGNATIEASGNITGTPGVGLTDFFGLIAHAGDVSPTPPQVNRPGDASVHYWSGTIDVFGNLPRGIVVWAQGDGSATLTTEPGTKIIVSGTNTDPLVNPGEVPTLPVKAGIVLQLDSATAANNRAITANVASTITNVGPAIPDLNFFDFNNPTGIRTFSFADAPTTVTYTGPGITTQGGGGAGIMALSSSGSILVNAFGPINTTNGSNAVGILADSGNILSSTSTTGAVQVNATNTVSATGQFGVGISATAGSGGVMVNIPSGGSVTGGWQTDLTSVGPLYGLPAAGVVLGSSVGTATLTNGGSIGALSDRAVASSPLFPSNNTSIINNGDGIITGFVQLVGGNNSILNNGTFNLRHFADTTGLTDASGNGVRDTVRVAIADLGTGPNNSFTNNGTLALANVTGATTLDNTGQYLPLGNPNNAMALGGPLQGHLIGVQTFTNSGIIDLQQNPAPGDVLVITGARQAEVVGTGTYISNGGTLRLDTVLNQGGTATRSDTLVVDGTQVGAGGATKMAIRNAGGAGALTVGDGILVVQVLNPARSAAGAFSLAAPVTAGAFHYFLVQGGASPATAGNGNWYLRDALAPVSGGQMIPLFQPEVALKSVVPSVARTLGLVTLGTFNERQGDQLLLRGDMRFGAWGRVFGQHTRENFAQGAQPDFDGTFAGFQAGADLWRLESIKGHSDHIGFYVGQARASGSVHGLVDGVQGASAGHLDLDATSYGGYWTHLGRSNWYIDAVLQGTYFHTSANSISGDSNNFSGRGFAASLEAGYPIVLTPWLKFEPQIQGIWQRTSFDNTQAAFATIAFDRSDAFTGRIGALLRGAFGRLGVQWQPYLKGNVWWGSNGVDTVTFNGFGIPTGRNGGTTLEGGGGVTGRLTRYVSVYADASYLGSVSGETRNTLKGNAGLRVTW